MKAPQNFLEHLIKSADLPRWGRLGYLLGVALFALTSISARYWADDYCFSGALMQTGFWQSQMDYFMETSNRFTVLPIIGVSEWFGVYAIRLLPVMLIFAWLGALRRVVELVGDLLALDLDRNWIQTIIYALVFFLILLAPNRFQTIYWRSGLLTYTLPLLGITWLAGLILAGSAKPVSAAQLITVSLLAVFTAGCSETAAMLLIAGLALGLLVSFFTHSPRRAVWLALLGAALFGALLALGVMILSPAVRLRQANVGEPASLLLTLGLAFKFGLAFIYNTLKSTPLPVLVWLIFSGALTYHFWPRTRLKPWTTLRWAGLVALSGYLLIVAACIPSAYAQRAYPEPRAQIVLLFPLLLAAAALAALAALALRGQLEKSFPSLDAAPVPILRRTNLVITVLLLFALLYPLWPAWQSAPEQRELAARAQQWDDRHADIRAQIAAGAVQIQTIALDSIAGLEEMQPDPNHWVNVCAARYYAVDEIIAQIP